MRAGLGAAALISLAVGPLAAQAPRPPVFPSDVRLEAPGTKPAERSVPFELLAPSR